MLDTLGGLSRQEIIKIATSIGTYKNYTIYATSYLKAKCKIRKPQQNLPVKTNNLVTCQSVLFFFFLYFVAYLSSYHEKAI